MSKYEELALTLKKKIPQWLQEGRSRLPSEHELCEQFMLSRQTVRTALGLLEEEKLIRRERGSGSYLTGLLPDAADNRVAMLLTTDTDYIYPELLGNISRRLSADGFTLSVFTNERRIQREREQLQNLLHNPPRALIAEGCQSALPSPNIDLYRELEKRGASILFLYGRYPNLHNCICVQDDNIRGGFAITAHLLRRRHHRIAGIFQSDTVQGQERYYGYVDALRSFHAELPSDNVLWFQDHEMKDLQTKQDTGFLRTFIRKYLMSCTAVVCHNDEIAYWLIRELRREGIRVPEDLSVVGFDHSYLRNASGISLTTLTHEPHVLENAITDTLSALLKGEHPSSVLVPWRLVPGDSDRMID